MTFSNLLKTNNVSITENTKNAENIINAFWKASEKVQKEMNWMDKASAKQFKNILVDLSEVIDFALAKQEMKVSNEMFGGPMGGDQRNMRGSSDSVRNSDMFDGKGIKFKLGAKDEKDYLEEYAETHNVEIKFLYFKDWKIEGKKVNIKKFLSALNYKPREYKEYF